MGTFHGEVMGVEVQKGEWDLDRYRELIEISQPDLIIETGTRTGGSALWFHKEMDLQVVSIDLAPTFHRDQPPHLGPGIEWVTGHSSIRDHVVNAVLPLLQGKRVMVSLDSDHHSPHVQAEMAIWGQFVSPGCYLVVEDGCFDAFHDAGFDDWSIVGGSQIPYIGGPLDAIRKSGIESSSMWWRDESLEGMSNISHSPAGWWRKHE
jgi:cephalosporin hydroxylase